MKLHISSWDTECTGRLFEESELFIIPWIPIVAGDVVSLKHRQPECLSREERTTYIREIVAAYKALVDENAAGDDDRTYIIARWLQEALLIPKRAEAISNEEVMDVLVKAGMTTGNAVTIIKQGLLDRALRAMVENEEITIIRNGVISV